MKEQFELQLPDLLYFIKESCHENLHDTLNDLRSLSDEISKGENATDLPDGLPAFIKNFILEVKLHLALEENTFFPSISTGKRFTTDSIPHLLDDHDQMKINLLRIRQMTSNYQLPKDLNVKTLQFYRKLREMDRIILNHIQIEDHVLFPMIQKIS